MGTVFAIKNGEVKDKHICVYSTFKNTLAESHSGSITYGSDIALPKLLVFVTSLANAKNMEAAVMHPQKIFLALREKMGKHMRSC